MPRGVIQFDEFALDRDRFELLRAGDRVKLEKLPMELLILLVEKDGHLVTRQEIVERLWGAEVFLDTEHGINTAIRKIRNALRDNPEQSRFVQTVTGKGYRFIAATSTVPAGEKIRNLGGAVTAEAMAAGGQTKQLGAGRATAVEPMSRAPSRHGRALRIAGLWLAAAAGVAVVIGLNVRGLRHRSSSSTPQHRIHSLAVLPLENLSGDPAQDYFADGMTDELITALAKDPGLRVISRTSVMQYRKVHRPLPEIARELGVDGILEGSVGRSGGRLHVNAQLVHARSDTHIWAESYDRDLNDFGALQNELARTIARQVGSTVSLAAAPPPRVGSEAHDTYLTGRYYWFAEDYGKSRQFFQKAIDLQPDYAAAWAGFADSYIAAAVSGKVPSGDVMPKAEAAARKALALDDSQAEAHLTMAAYYLFYRWDWQGAERESARALELNPGLAEAHHLRGYVMQVLGRTEEALYEQKKCMELDPSARRWALALGLMQARRFDAALEEARLRSEAHRDDAALHGFLFEAYWLMHKDKEAAQELERSFELQGQKQSALAVHQAFARGGMKAVWEWHLDALKRKAATGYVSPLAFATHYAYLHRREEALSYLEKAYEERVPWLVHMQSNGNYDFLRSEPRYQALIKKMGLPAVQ
jgi:TolB-like protein/DNA-binding winged helix-turn-helix (wHTH) protein/Tfp pilus assembly protein PilF